MSERSVRGSIIASNRCVSSLVATDTPVPVPVVVVVRGRGRYTFLKIIACLVLSRTSVAQPFNLACACV